MVRSEFDMGNFETSMRYWTIGGIVAIGVILCCLVACLLAMVATLTFDCWWTVGSLFNLPPTLGANDDSSPSSSQQKLLLTSSASNRSSAVQTNGLSPPMPHNQQNGVSKLKHQTVLFLGDGLEAMTAMI